MDKIMDMNALIRQHGDKQFKVDGKDEFGAYMVLDEYTVHLRYDDLLLTEGLTFNQIHPLITKVSCES
jgi:hypothetical protein